MSDTLSWLKEIYAKAKENKFEWKPIHANNLACNPVVGIYTDMFFNYYGKYMYVKYTIEYMSRCDETGLSHPEEGTKYYILHELVMRDLEEKFEIPDPGEESELSSEKDIGLILNNYGRFRYVFDDEDTARKVVSSELLCHIYPNYYTLSKEELKEMVSFTEKFN